MDLRMLAVLGAAGLAFALAPSSSPEGGFPTSTDPLRNGEIRGTVRLEGVTPPDPPPLSPYARRSYRPPAPSTGGVSSVQDVVVYVLVDGDEGGPVSTEPARVVQRNRTITPHVSVTQVGAEVSFPNQDQVFHNLFSLSASNAFNLGRYPPGESRTKVFDTPGVVRMFCDIHSEMNAVLLVLSTRHYARPAEDGSYRITGLPPGSHRVVAWHESGGADTVDVEVPSDGSAARADFHLGGG